MDGETGFDLGADVAAVLPVPIRNSKKMRILKVAEMRHRNPRVLVLFVRVAWRLPSFSRKCKLSHAVCEHL
jgi:hypothetical protein